MLMDERKCNKCGQVFITKSEQGGMCKACISVVAKRKKEKRKCERCLGPMRLDVWYNFVCTQCGKVDDK